MIIISIINTMIRWQNAAVATDPGEPDGNIIIVITPGLHHKISVFSDPDPGKS